jgi:hypothetical protein
VESPIIASTPSSPNCLRAASSVVSPTRGSGSSFQSPVWSTLPREVRRTTALGSGIEWVSVINCNSNGAISKRSDMPITVTGTSPSNPASSSFLRKTLAVNGVA